MGRGIKTPHPPSIIIVILITIVGGCIRIKWHLRSRMLEKKYTFSVQFQLHESLNTNMFHFNIVIIIMMMVVIIIILIIFVIKLHFNPPKLGVTLK